jgi:hypothetical protein
VGGRRRITFSGDGSGALRARRTVARETFILHQVAHRARTAGSLGKADIGALLLWKRLRADTRWAGALMAVADADVRKATKAATLAVRDTSLSRSQAAGVGRAALAKLPGFTFGDALASAVLTAAAPDRMAVYDRRCPYRAALPRHHAHPLPRPVQPLPRGHRPSPDTRPRTRPLLDTAGRGHRSLLPAPRLPRLAQRVEQGARGHQPRPGSRPVQLQYLSATLSAGLVRARGRRHRPSAGLGGCVWISRSLAWVCR